MNKKKLSPEILAQGQKLWDETQDVNKVMELWNRNKGSTQCLLGVKERTERKPSTAKSVKSEKVAGKAKA